MAMVEQLESVKKAHDNGAWAIASLSGDADVISGGCDGLLRTWTFNNGRRGDVDAMHDEEGEEGKGKLRCARKFERHSLPVVDVAVSKENDVAVSTSLDGVLKIWSIGCAHTVDPVGRSMTHPNVSDTWCVSVTRLGAVAVVGGAGGLLQMVDLQLGILDRTFSVVGGSGDGGGGGGGGGDGGVRKDGPMIMSVALSVDDRRAVVGSADGSVVEVDVEKGKVICSLQKNSGVPVRSVSYVVGDRKSVVTAGDDGLVGVVDLGSGDTVAALKGHKGMVFAAQASGDGRYIASGGSDGCVKVWDRAQRNVVFNGTAHGQPVWGVSWAVGDSHVLSVSDDGSIGLLGCRGNGKD